jgi:SSS family solute:Na+ symporter
MPGGAKKIFEIALENDKFDLGSFSLNLSESTFWVVMVYGIFINLQNFGIDQNYVQRYMASRDERNARRSAGFGSLLYIPVSMIFFMIGTSLFSYYRALPGHLPAIYNFSGMNDRVFPYFIAHELPVGLTGILIASVFAAGMSTVSTSINSSSTIILTDYVQRFSGKFNTEKEKLWILYWSSVGISVAGILTALAMINVESALDTWWKLASVFSGGMLGLFLLGVFVKKVNVKGTLIGVIIGLMVIFWMSLSSLLFDGTPLKVLVNPLHSYLTIVTGTVIIFLIGFLINILKRK